MSYSPSLCIACACMCERTNQTNTMTNNKVLGFRLRTVLCNHPSQLFKDEKSSSKMNNKTKKGLRFNEYDSIPSLSWHV